MNILNITCFKFIDFVILNLKIKIFYYFDLRILKLFTEPLEFFFKTDKIITVYIKYEYLYQEDLI